MGREEVLNKLNARLSKAIDDEPQVIFILSRIRKILESKKEKSTYKYLNFYCNWVLHMKLDKPWTTALLSDKFEQDIDCDKSGHEIARQLASKHGDFFKLSSLKDDLKIFLKSNQLPEDLVTSNSKWTQFVKILLEIIKGSPIEFGVTKKVERMSLQKNAFGYYYKFDLKNCGRKPIVKLKLK